MKKSTLILLICTLFCTLSIGIDAQTAPPSSDLSISALNVLLPHSLKPKEKVTFPLEAYNGCFKWTSSNPDNVAIQMIHESDSPSCSKSCLISGITPSPSVGRTSSWITAVDIYTGKTLRCEVFLDWIKTIEIETTTRTISKDDIELLNIRAFDAEGNVFSSLLGLQFDWHIESLTILRTLHFRDSSIDIDSKLLFLEQQGIKSSSILVQGVEVGRVTVSAKLIEPEYQNAVPSSKVEISVMEPLLLKPSHTIYITPGTKFNYELQTFRRDSVISIMLPNSMYHWSTSNRTVATITESGLLTSYAVGVTYIQVQNADNFAKSTVYVVNPHALGLVVTPRKFPESSTRAPIWYLIVGNSYEIQVEVFDKANNKLFNTSSLYFQTVLNKTFFSEISSTSNFGNHNVTAIKEGSLTIRASLDKIQVEQQIIIQSPVQIVPNKTITLPSNKNQYNLRAIGGSGEYNWISSNSSVATVSITGIVTTHSIGTTQITSICKKNTLNKDSITVRVQNPAKIEFVPSLVEIQRGRPLHIGVRLLDKESYYFDNCTALAFNWAVSDSSIFRIQPDTNVTIAESCVVKTLLPILEGTSKFTVNMGGMSDTIQLFSFNPLQIISPETKSSLVTLGSSVSLQFTGGPAPWYQEPSLYTVQLEHSEKLVVSSKSSSGTGSSAIHTFVISCIEHTKETIKVSVGNRYAASHPYYVYANETVEYECSPPSYIYLTSSEFPTQATNCPDNVLPPSLESVKTPSSHPPKVHCRNARTLPLNVTVYNQDLKPFSNYSTLLLDWHSSNEQLASFQTRGKFQRLLDLSTKEGNVILNVNVIGYDLEILKHLHIFSSPAFASKTLKHSLELVLLPNIRLVPEIVSIYNDASNKLQLKAVGGSGFYQITGNNSDISSLDSSQLVLIPKKHGTVQLTITDNCLTGSDPAHSVITIAEMASIRLKSRDLIQVGEVVDLDIDAFDQFGKIFGEDQQKYMTFTLHTDNDIIQSTKETSFKYKIKGHNVGTVLVTASSRTRSGITVTSKPLEIHVYPPFKLYPKNLVLLKGSSFQVQHEGGPPVRHELRFSVDNEHIAKVDNNGIIQGLQLGQTKLTAVIEAYDPVSNKNLKLGEDSVNVQVQMLDGFRIHTTTTKLLSGNEITAKIMGTNGETPFTFGSLDMKVQWEAVDGEIVELLPIYKLSNVTLQDESDFSVRVLAKTVGTTKITAILASSIFGNLQASAQMTVVETLRLTVPEDVLLPPASRFTIKTNRDLTSKSLSYELLGRDGAQIVDLSKDGKLITKAPGVTYIMVKDDSEIFQSVVLKVTVKSLHGLQILPHTPNYFAVPLGTSMEFSLNFRDDLGNPFTIQDVSQVKLQTQLNRQDIVSAKLMSNSYSLLVKALTPGEVIVRVLMTDFDIDDYIRIRVGHVIIPVNPTVHLGGKIFFSTAKTVSSAYVNENWYSDDIRIASVEQSGTVTANNLGSTKIYHNGTVFTYTQVNVVKVEKIYIHSGGISQLTNIPQSTKNEYKIKLSFYTETSNLDLSSSLIDHNLKIECSIEQNAWATARSYFDHNSKQYYCIIVPYTTSPSNQKYIDTLTLSVTLTDENHSYEVKQQESFRFIPAFSIKDKTEIIRLSPTNKYTTIQAFGQVDSFTSADPKMLQVKKLESSGDSSTFEVVVINDSEDFSLPIQFTRKDPYQNEEIVVFYTTKIPQPLIAPVITATPTDYSNPELSVDNSISSVSNVLIGFTVVTLALLLCLAFGGTKPQQQSQQNTVQRSPIAPSGFSSPMRFNTTGALSPSLRQTIYDNSTNESTSNSFSVSSPFIHHENSVFKRRSTPNRSEF